MDRDREKIRIAVRDPFCRVCLPSPDLPFVVPTSARGPVHTQIALNAVVSRRIVRAGSTLRAFFSFTRDDVTDPPACFTGGVINDDVIIPSAGFETSRYALRLMHHRSLCFQVTAESTSSAASS